MTARYGNSAHGMAAPTSLPADILLPYDLTTDIGMRKAQARTLHDQLLIWTQGLIEEGVFHPADEVAIGHDFLLYAHHASYVVFNSSTWTATQQIAWADKMSTGALDVTRSTYFLSTSSHSYDSCNMYRPLLVHGLTRLPVQRLI